MLAKNYITIRKLCIVKGIANNHYLLVTFTLLTIQKSLKFKYNSSVYTRFLI
jgi:hypothetical protein